MKSKTDLVKGWLRKGESDLSIIRMCLNSNQSLDVACFHAQQAAEKYIKAYLTAYDIDFPYIHNLEKLIVICSGHDHSFDEILAAGSTLTPYAVQLRYDSDFWPDMDTAKESLQAATKITSFILERLPPDMQDAMNAGKTEETDLTNAKADERGPSA